MNVQASLKASTMDSSSAYLARTSVSIRSASTWVSSVGFRAFPDGVATPRVFTALVDHNEFLEEGQLIERITDLDGSPLAEVHSPVDGIVHTMYVRNVVYPGDRLFTLLKIDEPTGWRQPGQWLRAGLK